MNRLNRIESICCKVIKIVLAKKSYKSIANCDGVLKCLSKKLWLIPLMLSPTFYNDYYSWRLFSSAFSLTTVSALVLVFNPLHSFRAGLHKICIRCDSSIWIDKVSFLSSELLCIWQCFFFFCILFHVPKRFSFRWKIIICETKNETQRINTERYNLWTNTKSYQPMIPGKCKVLNKHAKRSWKKIAFEKVPQTLTQHSNGIRNTH